MNKIIVTGAAGFIGSNLCKKLLSLGHIVIGIDNFLEVKKKIYQNIKTLFFINAIFQVKQKLILCLKK